MLHIPRERRNWRRLRVAIGGRTITPAQPIVFYGGVKVTF